MYNRSMIADSHSHAPQAAPLGLRPLCLPAIDVVGVEAGYTPTGQRDMTKSELIAELAASNPHLRPADAELIVIGAVIVHGD